MKQMSGSHREGLHVWMGDVDQVLVEERLSGFLILSLKINLVLYLTLFKLDCFQSWASKLLNPLIVKAARAKNSIKNFLSSAWEILTKLTEFS